jgi:membrane protein DedA with SNARE-associated domain
MTLRQIIGFFIKFKYQAIFPIAVLEGPIITIISGFLVSRGRLSFLPALLVVYFGDVVSDSVFHFVGRGGRYILPYLKFLRISEERLERLENQFTYTPWRTMIIAKLSYGLGSAFMIASGAARMSLKKFLEYMLSLNFIRSSILFAIGYYFGRAAVHLGPTYIKYYIIAVVILVPAGYLIYRRKNSIINNRGN